MQTENVNIRFFIFFQLNGLNLIFLSSPKKKIWNFIPLSRRQNVNSESYPRKKNMYGVCFNEWKKTFLFHIQLEK